MFWASDFFSSFKKSDKYFVSVQNYDLIFFHPVKNHMGIFYWISKSGFIQADRNNLYDFFNRRKKST